MRKSGGDRDVMVIFVPVILLVVVGIALAGNTQSVFGTLEHELWKIVDRAGAWVSSLLS